MRSLWALLVCLMTCPARAVIPVDAALCRAAIASAEQGASIPDRLLDAIAVVESGRRDAATGAVNPWPWTINVQGIGHVFESKAEAIGAVEAFRARGARSIDVGCMQVNLLAHPDAFASLDEAFDPAANARYAARFLTQLYQSTGAWPRAAAGYHSMTPGLGEEYARKVLAVWQREQESPAEPTAPRIMAAIAPAGRIQLLPPATFVGTPASAAGRGLDDYRAAPTRPTQSFAWFRRF